MTRSVGNFSKQEVLGALGRNLGRRRESLLPEDVRLEESGDELRLVVTLLVDQEVEGVPDRQRWEVAFPASREEMDELTHLETFRIIYRALIEEWWDTLRWGEPSAVRKGRRLA